MLYTDPGSGALLWQVLMAGAVGALFYFRKVLMFFRGKPRAQERAELEDQRPGKP